MPQKKQLPVKTLHQIAIEYGISYQTLHRRITKLKIELPTGLLFPIHQKLIYEALSYPPGNSKADFADI
jgi:DNA invertase Pin-like site-specific DNA recombinase